jgi:hypothetical protein
MVNRFQPFIADRTARKGMRWPQVKVGQDLPDLLIQALAGHQ